MMQTAQIGEPAAQQPSVVLDTAPPSFDALSGLLGNRRAQVPAMSNAPEFAEEEVWPFHFLRKRFVNAQPNSRLLILKRHKFTSEGREQRIRASLDALNAAQPITLKLEEWKEIVAEAEEDDED